MRERFNIYSRKSYITQYFTYIWNNKFIYDHLFIFSLSFNIKHVIDLRARVECIRNFV